MILQNGLKGIRNLETCPGTVGKRILLSVAIITLNEERKLSECLASVPFADEIVIVDSGSSDGTEVIARSFNADFSVRSFDNFSNQKNAALDRTGGEWVLFLDADERLTPELQEEIKSIITNPSPHFTYYLKRRNFLFGGRMRFGASLNDWQLRLVRRGHGQFHGLVHERVQSPNPPGRLRGELIHTTYQTTGEYFLKFNLFTSLDAENMWKQGKKPTLAHFLFKPTADFFYFYFFRLGILDGFRGFLYQCLAVKYLYVKYIKTLALYRQRGYAIDQLKDNK